MYKGHQSFLVSTSLWVLLFCVACASHYYGPNYEQDAMHQAYSAVAHQGGNHINNKFELSPCGYFDITLMASILFSVLFLHICLRNNIVVGYGRGKWPTPDRIFTNPWKIHCKFTTGGVSIACAISPLDTFTSNF